MADQPPETPEALAEMRQFAEYAERCIAYDRKHNGELTEETFDLIRTRDAALIAQHTAELTRERDEAEAVKGEQAAAERIVQLEGKVRWLEAAQREVGDRNAHLESQLAASAQREASARAEAREAALREAIDAVDAAIKAGNASARVEAGRGVVTLRMYAIEPIEQLLTSPRVDAWVRTAERVPPNSDPVQVASGGVVQLVAWRYIAFVDGWECAVDVTEDVDGDTFSHWQPLPPPPAHQPAAGTEGPEP